MKTGALIFAYNNDDIDYVRMAAWSAKNIRRHLCIPVALVTDYPGPSLYSVHHCFDHVIHLDKPNPEQRYFDDLGKTVNWYNTNRPNALNVTPWDRTLVLDADYVIASSSLSTPLLMPGQDFWCFHTAYDLTSQDRLDSSKTFGEHQYPMSWATVMIFNRTNQARFVFDSMQMIRNNWDHYRDIYKIQRPTYRNDIALSIALKLVYPSRGSDSNYLGMMPSVMPEDKLQQIDQDYYTVEYIDKSGRPKSVGSRGLDFQAMNKQQLGEIVAASI